MMERHGWDMGVDYKFMYRTIVRHLRSSKGKDKCYDAVLLIQLRNGSRISEAVRAFKKFVLTRKREVRVKVSKKRRYEERLMVIPNEITEEMADECSYLSLLDDGILIDRLRKHATNKFGVNTHSLRYAFITYLARQGVNPLIIAKTIHHARLDNLLNYIQVKESEDLLREL
ncbi:MAG: hypothetical protein QXX84_09065 [Sulfolobales archaeon]